MTVRINVPNVYDNHALLASAFRPFLAQHPDVNCAVHEPAESVDWIFVFTFPSGRTAEAILPAPARMQVPDSLVTVIQNGIKRVLTPDPSPLDAVD
jgi:hypothetical protein